MARPIQAHGKRSKVYGPVLIAIFRRKFKEGMVSVTFTLDEIRAELIAQDLEARNAPDLIYRMKSRTQLPEEIQLLGFRILSITGRGKYALLLGDETLIGYPDRVNVEEIEDRTPAAVRELLPEDFGAVDEQMLLSVLRYNDLFTRFLGVPTFHLKSHVRKSVPNVGQAEVDDVHVAIMPGRSDRSRLVIVPVEAKAKDDPVNRVQIAMQVRYAMHAYPNLDVRPLTVKLFDDGVILFMEFEPTFEPNDLAILRHTYYRLTAPQTSPKETTR
jgi:hypothetical protein